MLDEIQKLEAGIGNTLCLQPPIFAEVEDSEESVSEEEMKDENLEEEPTSDQVEGSGILQTHLTPNRAFSWKIDWS